MGTAQEQRLRVAPGSTQTLCAPDGDWKDTETQLLELGVNRPCHWLVAGLMVTSLLSEELVWTGEVENNNSNSETPYRESKVPREEGNKSKHTKTEWTEPNPKPRYDTQFDERHSTKEAGNINS